MSRLKWMLALIACTPLVAAGAGAEDPESTPMYQYGWALGRIYGEDIGMSVMAELCAGFAPDNTAQFDQALVAWREQHRAVFDEVRQRFIDLMKQLGGLSDQAIAEFLQQKRDEAKKHLAGVLESMPPFKAGLACTMLPNELTKPEHDPEVGFAKELAIVRSQLPPEASAK